MVDIIRRKNAQVQAEDVSAVGKATVSMINSIGSAVADAGSAIESAYEKHQKQKLKEQKYQEQVQENIYKAQEKIRADEQKAFDASDKIVAADMAGRLKNDLLRWNLEQRQNNPNFIGTAEHEKRMRDEYTRLANKYGAGLGEAGRAEFTTKTQNAVNEFIGNDVKWAYQQKLKKGEESAKQIAETMNQTAGMYGANGDVEGFKESHKEARQQLADYAEETGMQGAQPALYELDKKSLIDFYTNMAQTNPRKAKMLLEDADQFKETVPEDMLSGVNDIIKQSQVNALNEKLDETKIGLHESKKDSPQHKQLEKQKKKLEKDLKKIEESDLSEESLGAINKEVSDAVKPVLEKSLGEFALMEKQDNEKQKVSRFLDYMKLPTPENLKWFEQDNQMSYTPNVENMTELPEEMKSQKQKNNDLLKNMMKYRENFGNVSMVEISDYKGTKQMFDDFKAAAQVDSDKDGNMDNVLLKTLVAANNAKKEEISETDYNNYVTALNRMVYDATYKKQINDFIENTKQYLPNHFWQSEGNTMNKQATEIEEIMNGRTRDVLLSVVAEWAKGEMSGEDITKMYISGLEKAYNDTVSDYLGFDMNRVVNLYKETGKPVYTKIHNVYYEYHGTDPSGNPIWLRAYVDPKRISGANVEPEVKSTAGATAMRGV